MLHAFAAACRPQENSSLVLVIPTISVFDVHLVLVLSGFLEAAVSFVLEGSPSVSPQVSTASTGIGVNVGGDWKAYFERTGLPAALKVLAGLCRGHAGAQGLLSMRGLLQKLHWMEGTSTSGEVSHHSLMGWGV